MKVMKPSRLMVFIVAVFPAGCITPRNLPPHRPVVPSKEVIDVAIGETAYVSAFSWDPDGDSVSLQFDWNDGHRTDWTEFVADSATVASPHAWQRSASYTVSIVAKDKIGAISEDDEKQAVRVHLLHR
jgi:hypothetical protein